MIPNFISKNIQGGIDKFRHIPAKLTKRAKFNAIGEPSDKGDCFRPAFPVGNIVKGG
jgi:hypothetical protein